MSIVITPHSLNIEYPLNFLLNDWQQIRTGQRDV